MARLRVHNFTLSLDGYAAGPDQSLENPLGSDGQRLHEWAFATRTFREMFGTEGGGQGTDDRFAAEGDVGIGATIMGRNMFGPVRGPWADDSWTGWWGPNPPFHHPVFVLTHHDRPPVVMEGGTLFYFVRDGIEAALQLAFRAAHGKDVRLGGGVSTIQQYLRAGLIDELHLAIVPVLLGRGERLFENLDGGPVGYRCEEFVGSRAALHVRLTRS
jgi:dihydrofolate reductase